MNIFDIYAKFIDIDHRTRRPKDIPSPNNLVPYKGYSISSDFMQARCSVMLPPELIIDKTILDIGSCYGAVGAWCLHHGAKHYTGLEPQEKMARQSEELLKDSFNSADFLIDINTFEGFETDKKYDIVIASGVIYAYLNSFDFIKKVTTMCNDFVIIESAHPYNGYRYLFKNDIQRRNLSEEINMIELAYNRPIMVSQDFDGSICCSGAFPSVRALDVLFDRCGWIQDKQVFQKAESEIPETYNILHGNRFITKFVKSNRSKVKTFAEIYKDDAAERISWLGHSTKQ